MNNVAQNASHQDFAVRQDRFRKFGQAALLASTVAFAGLMQGCASTASIAPSLALAAPAPLSNKTHAAQPAREAAPLVMAVVAQAPSPADDIPGIEAPAGPAASAIERVRDSQGGGPKAA